MSHAALGLNPQTGACPRWLWRLVRLFTHDASSGIFGGRSADLFFFRR
jgi:hypothetical protein